jgi:hypothetical protein
MNEATRSFLRVMAAQAVERYTKNPAEFEFITAVRHMSRAGRTKLKFIAQNLNAGRKS